MVPVFAYHRFRLEQMKTLRLGTFNLVFIALSASALTTDETLDEVFGEASNDQDATRLGIRIMVNHYGMLLHTIRGVHVG